MICSALNKLFRRNQRKLSDEEYHSEEVIELKKDHKDLEDEVTRDEEKYFWRRYSSKGRNMSPLAVLSFAELSSENKDFRKLLQCLYQGNITAFTARLKSFSTEQLDTLEIDGQKILHFICFRKDIDALRIILDLEVQINISNVDGIAPLHIAVIEGWIEGVEELLFRRAASNALPSKLKIDKFPWCELPVHTAARNGNFTIASLLLDRSPDLTLVNSEGNTVLHLAALSHCPELITRLIGEAVVVKDISVGNNNGNTPLHTLMMGENLPRDETQIWECLQILLQNGANIHRLNVAGKSPLFLAARANLPLIVRSLLNAGADPTVICNDGRSILHAACKSDSHESLALLIASGKVFHLVLQVDNRGLAPFHYAVSSCSIGCCELLLEHGDHLMTIDYLKRTRCSLILKNMPSAKLLLKKIFDSNIKISTEDVDDPDFKIQMDFAPLLSTAPEGIGSSLVIDLNNSNGDSLMKHPLIESFLHIKWRKIRGFFFAYFLIYFLFLLVHTYYIIKTFDMATDWTKEENIQMMNVIHWFHVSLLALLVLPSFVTIFANFLQYLKQWETYFKVVALSFAAIVVFGRESLMFQQQRALSRNIATCSIFFTWVEFMMLLGRFPSLGVYILMFTRVSKSVIKFLFAFSPLIIAFSLSFSILFTDIDTFHSYPTVFVRTLMMMIGEIDFSAIHKDNMNKEGDPLTMVTSQIFLVVFVVLVPILMANLLIGLAVSDLPDLQLQGKIRRLVKEASYLESYERLMLLLNHITRHSCPHLRGPGSLKNITIYPNQLHRRDSVSIPAETLEAVIAAGTKEKWEDGLKASFKRFQKQYAEDRISLERALQTIFDAINQNAMVNDEGADSASNKRKKSTYELSMQKLFIDTKDML